MGPLEARRARASFSMGKNKPEIMEAEKTE